MQMFNKVPAGVVDFVSRVFSLDRDFDKGKSIFVDLDYKGQSYTALDKNTLIGLGSDKSDTSIDVYKDPYWTYEKTNHDFSFISPSDDYIEETDIKLRTAEFGIKGMSSKLHDCWGQIEWSFDSARHAVVGLLPYSFYRKESSKNFINRKLDYQDGICLVRLFLDQSIFKDGIERVLCLWALKVESDKPDTMVDRLESFSVENSKSLYNDFWSTHAASPLSSKFGSIQRRAHLIEDPEFEQYDRRSLKSISTQVGVSDRGEAKLALGGRSGQVRVSADPNVGYAKYKLWKDRLGKLLNKNTKRMKPLWDHYRRKRQLVDNPRLVDFAEKSLESMNMDVKEDRQVKDWLKNSIVKSRIEQADFEKWIENKKGNWNEIYKDTGVRNVCTNLYKSYLGQIDSRIDWPLYDFQRDDLARLLVKDDAIYVSFLGSGKSRQALSYIYMRDGKYNTIVLESRLIREMLKEVDKIGFPRDWINIIDSPRDARLENLGRLNLVSYSRIWRPVNDNKRTDKIKKTKVTYYTQNHKEKERVLEGHLDAGQIMDRTRISSIAKIDHVEDTEIRGPQKTIGHLLRERYMNTVICDEAHRLKGGKSTLQAKTAQLLRAKHTILMTGTAFKNYPRDIYALLVQSFGDNTTSNRWGYNHDILDDEEPVFTSQKKIFNKKFVQRGFDNEGEDNKMEGREIPKVPEESMREWREMLSPKILRRNRYEPEVIKDIPQPKADEKVIKFKITKKHAEFYRWWLEDFEEWFIQNSSDGSVGGTAILVQLNKLRFASTFPQSPKLKGDNVPPDAPIWRGGLTSKQEGIRDKLVKEDKQGKKALLFSEHPGCLEYMQDVLKEAGVKSLLFTGRQEMDYRLDNLDTFRESDKHSVLLMSRQCGQAGYNIEIADVTWSIDYPWVPSAITQAEGRMLRPGWPEMRPEGAVPRIRRSYIAGTVDEYMKQKVDLKTSGIDEAMDHTESDIDPSDYMSLYEFAENMLLDLGMGK